MIMALSLLVVLTACGSEQANQVEAVEIVALRDWQEELAVDGVINAAASTQLNVPGTDWDFRNLVTMVENGSMVTQGQVLAQFESVEAKVNLAQAEIDLARIALSDLGIQAIAEQGRAELSSDMAKVSAELSLSKRYTDMDLQIFAKNRILDTLADIVYLQQKQDYLKWRHSQIEARIHADRAVMQSHKERVTLTIAQQNKSLSALVLRAPHQGIFFLKARADGSLPQVGSKLWAGEEFGSLPDIEQQVARFSIAENTAFGLKEGLPIKVRLSGTNTELPLKLTKLGRTASTKSSETPVKYSDFEASIGQELVRQYDLKPGQAMTGRVILLSQHKVLTVPNVAIVQEGKDNYVYLLEKSKMHKTKIELGLRGQIRSEVKSGLHIGAKLVLVPTTTAEIS